MKKILSLTLFLSVCLTALAQMMEPIKFSTNMKMLGGSDAEIIFSATIDKGWHVYSTDLGDAGPIEASFNIKTMEGVKTVGKLMAKGNEINHYDDMFGCNLRYFEGSVTFVQKIKFTEPEYTIDCFLEYGACDDKSCLPPSEVRFKQSGKVPAAAVKDTANDGLKDAADADNAKEVATGTAETKTGGEETDEQVADSNPTAEKETGSPADFGVSATTTDAGKDNGADGQKEEKVFKTKDIPTSLWMIFIAGLVGGFLALLTPCVWPIIPMTVSFFLKRNKDHSKAVREAVIYGISIVVIYVLLGFIVTLSFGASTLNALSTNAVFNIFFCLLLIVFAASFFGAFEITLPSSWNNAIDKKSSSTTGLVSIFFMAFTLALVSFSCTGPIIGFLLVAVSTQDEILAPLVGMFGFAVALAIPFTLFAMFPSLLKAAPKSGGWMNTVKVVLGFIELAFALKFLSVADLAYGWHILDREVFLCLWIMIFGLLGVYLLGWLKFPHDDAFTYNELGEQVPTFGRTNVPQFFGGMLSLAFALYMIPGLWGAPLKAISAFAPPMNTQDFIMTAGAEGTSEKVMAVEAKYKDYDEAVAAAKREGKPMMLDFTGFGCVNCRKMEAAVWTDPEVA
ncbi:MAG: thioredoxin family protein, partial [Bacteroidaceae bacterium]|nr:thioredoxin family protein [Bacteroidaceae bacterium]